MAAKQAKGTPSSGLIGGTLGFFVGFAAVALFGPSAKKFQEVMHLTPLLLGLLVAAPNLSGSLLRIPFGAWVDSTGGRKPLLALLVLSIVGMGGLTWFVYARYPDQLTADYYWLLFFLGVLSGCGIATFSVGIGQVSYWFPQSRQGAALGTYAGVGNLAPGMFSFLLPISLGVWGLAPSYLAWFIFLAAGTVLYYFAGANAPYFQYRRQGGSDEESTVLARDAGQEIFPRGNAVESLRAAGKNWRTWSLTVIYFTSFGGFLALTAWLPTYWATYHDQALKTAGLLTALYSL
ncbi:MAG: nitrate/nitrite transporter, partial [Armatimonadota bacterium]